MMTTASKAPPRGRDLTTGPIGRTLFVFSLPVLGSNVLQSLSGSINAVWVGRFLGERALTATSNANLVLFLLLGAVFGVGMAATILVGQAVGARDPEKAREVIGTVTAFFFVAGFVMSVAGFLLTPTILAAMHTPPDARDLAEDYLRVIFVAMPFMYMQTLLMMVLRGSGDARTPFAFMGLSALLDVALNPLLIRGMGPFPEMGIAGAATATLIAQSISLFAMLGWIYARRFELRLHGASLRYLLPNGTILWTTIRKGLPMGAQVLVMSLASIAVISLVNGYGSQVSAAYGVTAQLWSYIQMPAMAIGAATSSMAAQNVGAGRWDRVARTLRAAIVINLGLTGFSIGLLYLFDTTVIGLFLPHDTGAVAIARHIAWVVNWSFVFTGVTMVVFSVTRATGAVLAPLAILIVSLILIRLPLAYIFTPRYGQDVIWGTQSLSSFTSMALSLAYYRFGGWRKSKMVEELDSGEVATSGVATPAMDALADPELVPTARQFSRRRNESRIGA